MESKWVETVMPEDVQELLVEKDYEGYSSQYLQLNALRKDYDGSFEVLAMPCHQFLLQEPAKDEELLNSLKYVRPGNGYEPNFIMTAKDEVNGQNEHPLYTFLKSRCPPVKDTIGNPDNFYWSPIKNGDITWNFNKFLIHPNGQPYKRYDSAVEPPAIEDDIREILGLPPVGLHVAEAEQNDLTVRGQFKRLFGQFQDGFYNKE
ncbi:glutathione peroxidase-like [Amphiura filiformis]|uniref:glutathione peroxidase-like n=1 Tax=Amphiura filiformis TaxID=82378 RepID=UPI003B2142E9